MPNTQPGCGSDWWARKTNRYCDCSCEPTRYDPRKTKPTDPLCPTHGDKDNTR